MSFNSFGRGILRHADEHGQSGVDVPELRAMERSGVAARESDGDETEGAGRGTPRHVDEHGQSGIYLEITRLIRPKIAAAKAFCRLICSKEICHVL
jgi:hypothetical protein